MAIPRCPGQDQRFWKPDDIFEVACPFCGRDIEFWKDDPVRPCPSCKKEVRNPRLDLACAKWCKYAKQCLGTLPESPESAASLLDRLTALQDQCLANHPDRRRSAQTVLAAAEKLLADKASLAGRAAQPLIVKAAALLAGAMMPKCPDEPPPGCSCHKPGGRRPDILDRAGLPAELADRVWTVVQAVLAGRPGESPEHTIVSRAMRAADAG